MTNLPIKFSDTTADGTPGVYSLNVFVQPFIDSVSAFQQYMGELLSRDPEAIKNRIEAFSDVQKNCAAASELFAPITDAVNENSSRTLSLLARGTIPVERTVGLSELAVSQTREALTLALSGMLGIVPEGTPHYVTIQTSLDTIKDEVSARTELKALKINSGVVPI